MIWFCLARFNLILFYSGGNKSNHNDNNSNIVIQKDIFSRNARFQMFKCCKWTIRIVTSAISQVWTEKITSNKHKGWLSNCLLIYNVKAKTNNPKGKAINACHFFPIHWQMWCRELKQFSIEWPKTWTRNHSSQSQRTQAIQWPITTQNKYM